LGRPTLDDILSRLSTVEKSVGRPINPTVYSVVEFKSKLASGNHFLNAYSKDKRYFCWGTRMSLERWVEYGLAKEGANQPR